MKKASEIISHIFEPFSDKIQKHRCLKKIISLMPPKYKKFILSVNHKGEVLYIRVSHPAIRQELFYKRNEILTIIKTMHNHGICKEIKVSKIVTDYKYSPPPKPPKEIKFYLKEAKDFQNRAKTPEIKRKFEEIKEILSARNT